MLYGRKSFVHVLILGAAGMIGRKLTARLVVTGTSEATMSNG